MKKNISLVVLLIGFTLVTQIHAFGQSQCLQASITPTHIEEESESVQNQSLPSAILWQVAIGMSATLPGGDDFPNLVRWDGGNPIIAVEDCGRTERIANPSVGGSGSQNPGLESIPQEIQSKLVNALGRMR